MYTQGGHVHAGVAGGSCAHMGGRGVMHTQGWQGGHVHAGVARGSCARRGGMGVMCTQGWHGGHVHAGVAGGSCARRGGAGVMCTQGWQGGHPFTLFQVASPITDMRPKRGPLLRRGQPLGPIGWRVH